MTKEIIQIPFDATCRSLIEAARDALSAPKPLSCFDETLLRASFPVKPGIRYRFKRTPLGSWTSMPDVHVETHVEGFTGNTAAWLVLMTILRPVSGFCFTLLTEADLVQLDGDSGELYFYADDARRDLDLEGVRDGWSKGWEVYNFREEPPPT